MEINMTSQDKESSNIAPTLTMAQLYEAQEQYFNALKIYKELQDQDYSEEIEDKITSLNEKINKQNKKKLDETIIQIFSEAEIEKFNILASDLYQQFEKSNKSEDEDIEDELEEEIDEDELYDEPEIEDEPENIRNYQLKKPLKTQPIKETKDSKDIKISDLSDLLLNITQDNKRIKDLTLNEILQLLNKLSD